MLSRYRIAQGAPLLSTSRALENYGIISKHYTSLLFILVGLQAKLNIKKNEHKTFLADSKENHAWQYPA